MENQTSLPSFSLGQTVVTPDALSQVYLADIHHALQRHARGDWGEVSPEERAENGLSLQEGGYLRSAFRDQNGTEFWVITEPDRSSTTVYLAEY